MLFLTFFDLVPFIKKNDICSMKKIIYLSLTLLLLSCSEDTKEKLVVYQSPTCGCCDGWVDNMKTNGMNVEAIKTNDCIIQRLMQA